MSMVTMNGYGKKTKNMAIPTGNSLSDELELSSVPG